jgi:hypothetical protein
MQDGVLLVSAQSLGRRCQLIERHVLERPAVRQRHLAKFVRGLGERHIQAPLTPTGPLQKKLQRERRLSRARLSFDEIEPVLGQSAP